MLDQTYKKNWLRLKPLLLLVHLLFISAPRRIDQTLQCWDNCLHLAVSSKVDVNLAQALCRAFHLSDCSTL